LEPIRKEPEKKEVLLPVEKCIFIAAVGGGPRFALTHVNFRGGREIIGGRESFRITAR